MINREYKPNTFRVGISEHNLTNKTTYAILHTNWHTASGCGEHSDVKQKCGEAAA